MQKYVLIALLVVLVSCAPEERESPTKGHVHVLIAESIAPAMIEEAKTFVDLYRQNGADVTYDVVPAEVADRMFVHDTVRMIFTTIPLTNEEKSLVRQSSGGLVDVVIAWDGVAAMVHYKNPTDEVTTTELREILSGRLTRWEQLSHRKGMKGIIKLYIQDSSDIFPVLTKRLLHEAPITNKNVVHTHSSLETLHLLVQDERSLGFVGIDWIDSAKVPAKPLELCATEAQGDTIYKPQSEADGRLFFSPHPAHIYRSYYPLRRAIVMYTKSERADVASGFGTFVANKEGQAIFLRRGLVPGTQPIKLKR